MGEPQMNDQVNESVGSGPQWIGWTLVAFILFTPFIVIKLMDGKTKQAKHNTYIHVMMITIEQYIDVYGKFELKYNNKQYKTIKI